MIVITDVKKRTCKRRTGYIRENSGNPRYHSNKVRIELDFASLDEVRWIQSRCLFDDDGAERHLVQILSHCNESQRWIAGRFRKCYSPRTWEGFGTAVNPHMPSQIMLSHKSSATNQVSRYQKNALMKKQNSPILSITDKGFIFQMCLDMTVDCTLSWEMSFTPFNQALEAFPRLTCHASVQSQECRVKLLEERSR